DSIYLRQSTARLSLAVGLSVSCPSCVLHVLSLFLCLLVSRFSGGSLDRPAALQTERREEKEPHTH
ncbi:hypothetical protein QBC32DRAFT_172335, partial [Pseudoneurospora amorphoporcata]